MTETATTTRTNPNPPDDRLNGPIHTWFGLSYSNYQVLHRTLMQSMPVEWQERMVACLDELSDAFRHIEHADCYEVTAASEWPYGELSEGQMKALGVEPCEPQDADPGEAERPNRFYDRDGNEHYEHDRVLVPLLRGDPVPHYNRGRTFVEPRIEGSEPR
jgi:hypothetical protein